jgi:threonine/homoserine/homoserine lactone efflux protein
LRTSVVAFEVVRWAGAAYMLYLGLRILQQRPSSIVVATAQAGELRSIFLQGVLTNVLNPKVALFFLAFLPQFISPGMGSPTQQSLVLGLIFNIGGTLVNFGVAFFAAGVGGFLARSRRAAEIQRWVTGLILVGLAVRLALQTRRVATP